MAPHVSLLAGFPRMVDCRCGSFNTQHVPRSPLLSVLKYSQPGWSAGSQDDLWGDLAAQKWPRQTLRLYPYYTTYKVSACLSSLTQINCQNNHQLVQELIQDDNRRSACPTIDLASMHRVSAYKYNRPSYFLECRLIALQWDRFAHLVR